MRNEHSQSITSNNLYTRKFFSILIGLSGFLSQIFFGHCSFLTRIILVPLFYVFVVSTSYACVCGTASLSGATNQVNGWAYDDLEPNKSLQIEIDMDFPHGATRPIALFTANLSSEGDSLPGNHSFSWLIPSQLQYSVHIWFVYAISAQGNNFVLLQNSPVASPRITLNEISPPESVYNYSTQACELSDISDHPARAFRTVDGTVTILATHTNARRNIGTTLDNVVHNCDIVWRSPMNLSFEKFKYMQWPETPYTLDGQNIFMIFHSEWYGANVDPKCNGDGGDSWVSAMLLGVSLSQGKKYHLLNDYHLRSPITPWETSFPCTPQHPTRYGSVGGSNIIHYKNEFYKFFIYEPEPVPFIGQNQELQCVMRTVDIGNTSAWQIWTNNGWLNSVAAPCAAIPNLVNVRSVTYNRYLKAYVAIQDFSIYGGFMFSVSTDLMNWSSPMHLNMSMVGKYSTCYPSLLDPTDTSLNFEKTGRFPYIYFSAPCMAQDNGLLRARVQFKINGI